LFGKYAEFNEKLKSFHPEAYYQWVDGSFVSKKELPGDIDFVTFVNWERFKFLKSKMLHLQREYSEWLDISYAVDYPASHSLHNITLILKDEYHHLYGSTRQHPLSKLSRPKGYLLIKFE
jgi:hypothetical protein